MDIDQQQLVPAGGQLQQQQQQGPAAPYNCPACCQKEADESRMDLLQLHAVVLADIKPNKPRPAAEIFAAEVTRKVIISALDPFISPCLLACLQAIIWRAKRLLTATLASSRPQ